MKTLLYILCGLALVGCGEKKEEGKEGVAESESDRILRSIYEEGMDIEVRYWNITNGGNKSFVPYENLTKLKDDEYSIDSERAASSILKLHKEGAISFNNAVDEMKGVFDSEGYRYRREIAVKDHNKKVQDQMIDEKIKRARELREKGGQ